MDVFSFLVFLNQKTGIGCVFFVFGCFKHLLNLLCLFLLFILGLKFLQFCHHITASPQHSCVSKAKSISLSNGFCSNHYSHGKKNDSSKLELFQIPNGEAEGHCLKDSDDSNVQECRDEDDDVVALRNMIKRERQRANAAFSELEKEREAVAAAVEDAMAVILQIQKDKSWVDLQCKQFQRLVGEKQLHDQLVIQSLRWMVARHESARSLLQDNLRFLKRKSERTLTINA